jgi:DNA-binding MarR family transcriptional regulator
MVHNHSQSPHRAPDRSSVAGPASTQTEEFMPASKALANPPGATKRSSRPALAKRAGPSQPSVRKGSRAPDPSGKSDESEVDFADAGVIDLERYAPAFLTWIAAKLSRGASQQYLRVFDVGIEIWRCMVLLAVEGSISAQRISKVIGMDKASVSRCFKSMQARGLITLELDAHDGRLRVAALTTKGRELHDQIRGIALERERAFLSVLSDPEREDLLGLLKRLHENLPEVERATQRYVERRFPNVVRRRPTPSEED